MNEADSVFSKEGFLVEVPYFGPSLLEFLMSSPLFQGLMAYERMICKMLCDICNILCAMCKMLCVVCNFVSMIMHVNLMS